LLPDGTHLRWFEVRAHVGAALAAGLTHEPGLDIRQPHVVRPSIGRHRDRVVTAIDQDAAKVFLGWRRKFFRTVTVNCRSATESVIHFMNSVVNLAQPSCGRSVPQGSLSPLTSVPPACPPDGAFLFLKQGEAFQKITPPGSKCVVPAAPVSAPVNKIPVRNKQQSPCHYFPVKT
jgi:hypothetical protein